MTAARILNMARRRAGLTQRELARRSGVPQPSISKIERGAISPTVDTLERLLRACGMELEPVSTSGEGSVDASQIRDLLTLTPSERLDRAVKAAHEIDRLRRSVRWTA